MAYHPPPFAHWLGLYLKTLAVEIPIYVLAARPAVPAWRAAAAAIACSTLTHPLLIYVWPHAMPDYRTYIVTGELWVAVVESVVFYLLARPVTWTRAIGASFLANGASYGLGALVHHLARG